MRLSEAAGILAAAIPDDGRFPNSRLPLLVYPQALNADSPTPEEVFQANAWGGTWRNGLYPYHHYHSTAHEVLAVVGGSASILFGGEHGIQVEARAGDCIVIPAGVAHKLIARNTGFLVVGGYPAGQSIDVCVGKPGERPEADRRIARVPLPAADPIQGSGGALEKLWTSAAQVLRSFP
jgi:uncharacterized protein YjlB